VQKQRIAAHKARLEAIEKTRSDVQKAFRKEQEAEKRKYLQKCQEALYYNKDNFKMLNQSLRLSEVYNISYGRKKGCSSICNII
jgi:hypothetical protein